jgi:hypothetical protein
MAHPTDYFFFVDNAKYDSDLPALTGAQIKAKVPNWDPAYGLLLEGHGNEPDRLISDTETVSLEKEQGPRRFTRVPPASFGGR